LSHIGTSGIVRSISIEDPLLSQKKICFRQASVLLLAASGLIAFLLSFQVVLWGYERCIWMKQPAYDLFKKTCGHCHDYGLAEETAQSPAGWRELVTHMIDRNPDFKHSLPQITGEKIAQLLIENRSADGEELFNWRCGHCHSKNRIDDYRGLTPQALELLIKQHARQKNHIIQKWEGDLIAAHVSAHEPANAPAGNQSPASTQLLYQQKCGECHTARMIYRTICTSVRDKNGWNALIQRMRAKDPDFISAEDASLLAAHAESICTSKLIAP
jgi:cytochrome c5